MDPTRIAESVLRGVLGGRRKRGRSALRYLVGGRGGQRTSFLTSSRLLMLAGVAWGLYETWKRQPASPASSPSPSTVPPMDGVPDHLGRLVRLSVAAARADGTLTDGEREKILEGAKEAGVEDLVAAEIASPTPLAAILEGVTDVALKRDVYVLAFTIVRADETVVPSERAWLVDLASRLGLAASEIERVETEAARAIDAGDGA